MAEQATDVETAEEITPEQFEGEEQVKPKAESSTAKSEDDKPSKDEKPEAEAKTKPEKAETKADDTETEAEEPVEDSKADETETEKPRGKAEERKDELNTEIRDLVARRNALRDEVSKKNAEVYETQSEEDLVGQPIDPNNPDAGVYSATDAKVEAMRQEMAMRDYNEKVAEAQLTLESEAQKVLTEFPIFNPDSDQYDKELAEEASELMNANLIYDQNTGQVIGANASPYKIYKTLARASGISATKGQMKGQENAEKMMANADNASAKSAAKTTPKDPLTELWEEDL